MTKETVSHIPEIDAAVKRADKKYDRKRQIIRQEEDRIKAEEELKKTIQDQKNRIIGITTERLAISSTESAIFEPLEYAQDKLGEEGVDIYSRSDYWTTSDFGLVVNGYRGKFLRVGVLKPKSYHNSKLRLACYGGLFVVGGISIDGLVDEQVEHEIQGGLRFWHGLLYDSSSTESSIKSQQHYKDLKGEKITSELKKLRSRKFFHEKSSLFRDALPFNPKTMDSRMQDFTEGLAGFVRSIYIPPDFRR